MQQIGNSEPTVPMLPACSQNNNSRNATVMSLKSQQISSLIICTLGKNKADIEFSTKMSTTNKICTGTPRNKSTGLENEKPKHN